MVIQRKVYGILDLLGDIGGLASSLQSSFFFLIIVFQYKAAVSYVSNHTFLVRGSQELLKNGALHDFDEIPIGQMEADVVAKEPWHRLKVGFFTSIKHSFQRLLNFIPCCGFCQRSYSRIDKLAHFSDKKVSDEMKIVRWIQFMRCAEHAMRTKLFKEANEWEEVVQESLFRRVEIKYHSQQAGEVEMMK